MKFETISWKNRKVVLIDQTKLPGKVVFVECSTVKQVWQAIKTLKVRGAPAIGAAAALGMALGVSKKNENSFSVFQKNLNYLFDYLASSRPTAVNLVWALERMRNIALRNKDKPIDLIKQIMFKEARNIIAKDKQSCAKMADNAQSLIKKNDRIMTYCNAGMLATVGMGTALGVIYRANQLAKNVKVFSCETRPLLQGARLTCWELSTNKVDVTVLCDNMAGYLMQQKQIDKIFVGADRIAANGDTANKIGSYSLAVLAKFHKVPFYVVAPASTFDLNLASGNQIPIEQRSASEIRQNWYKRPMVAEKVKVYNPAFDVVPAKLIAAIITDFGLIKAPDKNNIKRVLKP
ncbi:MAG: S-methyl-5-thioribose-1-phosphate isomerase [Candidatus Omnitrophica bacterium]|nr:S-methyl-5-thioribose-1-phosphate isomerase [Candidatus Omnitrophota bacterium]